MGPAYRRVPEAVPREKEDLKLAACFALLAGLTNGFNYNALNVMAIRAEWPASPEWIGAMATGTLVGAACASLVAGPVADRYGRGAAAVCGEATILR